jgi:hypothetical protein
MVVIYDVVRPSFWGGEGGGKWGSAGLGLPGGAKTPKVRELSGWTEED